MEWRSVTSLGNVNGARLAKFQKSAETDTDLGVCKHAAHAGEGGLEKGGQTGSDVTRLPRCRKASSASILCYLDVFHFISSALNTAATRHISDKCTERTNERNVQCKSFGICTKRT